MVAAHVESIPEDERTDLRFERKFTTQRHPRVVIALVKSHEAHFREIYHQRRVNNIYLDTLGYESFYDNTDGLSRRTKTRIRWYGNLRGTPDSMQLEYKHKRGLLGFKDTFAVQPFKVGAGMRSQSVHGALRGSDLPPTVQNHVRGLEPALLNSYERRYFVSRDERYRVTVDWDIKSWQLARGSNSLIGAVREPSVVVELKYDSDDDRDAHAISQLFPFRVSRNSKYVAGLASTHPEIDY